ncbi:MAG: redoxin domain-containing protein [Acidobacteriia bacterium]|nr:redoxin domain-containing protein [Terriglobia bacterium]
MNLRNHPAPCLLLVFFLGVALALPSKPSAAQDGPKSYGEELKRAQADLAAQQYNDAIRGFMRANKLKEDRSSECYWGIAQAYFELGAFPIVVENCDQALKYASDDSTRAQAHSLKGNALEELAGEKTGALAEAEGEYRAALGLKLSPPLPVLHFSLGTVLLKEGRVAAGIEELNVYLQLEPQGPMAAKARQAINDARQSPAPSSTPSPASIPKAVAPNFSFRTLQGQQLSRETLGGKIVLLDFWATWCAPCRAALPGLEKLHQKFAGEDRFVLISISADRSAGAWKEFVKNAGMDWPQYHDRDEKVQRLFSVRSFPTYVLIGPDGVILQRFSGWGGSRDRLLQDDINRMLNSLPRKPSGG